MLCRKKLYPLIVAFIAISSFGFADHNPTLDQNLIALYKKAAATDDAKLGIRLAKQSCALAVGQGNNVIRVKSLNLVAGFFWQMKANDSAEYYCRYALSASKKYRVDSLSADTWVLWGLVDYNRAAFESAIAKYNTAILLYHKLHKPRSEAVAYNNIGICETELSRNTEAIGNYMSAIKIFEKLKDSSNVASSCNAIAICFSSMNDYKKAIEYNLKNLAIRESLKDKIAVAQSCNNLGYVYKQYNRPDQAIVYLLKSIALYQNETDSSLLILPLQNLGAVMKMKGRQAAAERYLLRSLNICDRYGDKENKGRGDLDLAELYLAENKLPGALTNAKTAGVIARELQMPDLLMNAYADEAKIYAAQGNYKDALIATNRSNMLKDSLFTLAKNRSISDIETKYRTAEKEKDIAALSIKNQLETQVVTQQKKSIIVLVTGACMLVVLLVFAYRSYRRESRARQQVKTLMRDLHHRVKNNLQILSGLFSMQIGELSDGKAKNTLKENESRLASMNLIHSKLYLNEKNTQIEMTAYVSKLIEHISTSFDAEQNITINMHFSDDVINMEADKAVAVGIIINELACNAYKYAFNDGGGELTLALERDRKKLKLKFSDNGKGLKTGNAGKESFGLKLVRLMSKQLNATISCGNDNGAWYEFEMII